MARQECVLGALAVVLTVTTSTAAPLLAPMSDLAQHNKLPTLREQDAIRREWIDYRSARSAVVRLDLLRADARVSALSSEAGRNDGLQWVYLDLQVTRSAYVSASVPTPRRARMVVS